MLRQRNKGGSLDGEGVVSFPILQPVVGDGVWHVVAVIDLLPELKSNSSWVREELQDLQKFPFLKS